MIKQLVITIFVCIAVFLLIIKWVNMILWELFLDGKLEESWSLYFSFDKFGFVLISETGDFVEIEEGKNDTPEYEIIQYDGDPTAEAVNRFKEAVEAIRKGTSI